MGQQHLRLPFSLLRFGLIAILLLSTFSSAAPPVRATTPFSDSGADLIGVGDGVTTWADYDSDHDVDLILGGQMNTGNNVFDNFMKLYRNTNSTFTNSGTALPGIIGGTAQWGDYDNDGDPDLLVAGSYLLRIYRNDAGTLLDSAAGLDGMEDAAAAWGDYDNDGDLDFVVGGYAFGIFLTKIYRNNAGSFVDSGISLPGVTRGSFAWGDYDNDGDLDLFMMGYAGNAVLITRIYRNDNGALIDSGVALPTIMDGAGAWGDYDNDGDLDLVLTGDRLYEYIARVYRNDNGSFVNIGAGLPGIVGVGRWVDYDNDGDLDLHLSGRTTTSLINDIYSNNGGSFSAVNAGLPTYARSGSVWGDYDNDGRLDIVAMDRRADDSYVNRVYHNNTDIANAPPDAPGDLIASTNGTAATLSWSTATDDHTPQAGLTYNLRVGTASGRADVVAPMALDSGARQVIGMGNTDLQRNWTIKGLTPGRTYYWSVQAIDTAFAGSAFATEHSFVAGANMPPTPTPTPPPPAGCSISIDNGAVYVGHRQVHLWINVPGAAQMLLSNDGGFGGAAWQAYDAHADWTLSDPGRRIATLIVYARFVDANGAALCGGANISDDIIYDPLPPDVAASFETAAARTALTSAPGQFMLHIDASDQLGGSGVAEMRVGGKGTFDQAAWQPFSASLAVSAQPAETLMVQVRDRAGNTSAIVSTTAPASARIYLPVIVGE